MKWKQEKPIVSVKDVFCWKCKRALYEDERPRVKAIGLAAYLGEKGCMWEEILRVYENLRVQLERNGNNYVCPRCGYKGWGGGMYVRGDRE